MQAKLTILPLAVNAFAHLKSVVWHTIVVNQVVVTCIPYLCLDMFCLIALSRPVGVSLFVMCVMCVMFVMFVM